MGAICAKRQEVWNEKIWPIKHEIFIIWSYSESLLTSKLELVWLQVRKPTQIVVCLFFFFSLFLSFKNEYTSQIGCCYIGFSGSRTERDSPGLSLNVAMC